jgi:mono/diheme cytochrome c family protein
MYMIDANVFMNWAMGVTLAVAAVVFALTLFFASRGRTGALMSYLYMFSTIFGVFAVAVVLFGFRGRASENPPWHFFLDMKYQAKYTSQGQSNFFADGRGNRLPPADTVPYDGTDYAADAGFHADPNPDFLRGDRRYFLGVANADAKDKDGNPAKPQWKGGQLAGEGYYVNHIPKEAIDRANGWEALLKRGRHQFNVHCAACHGESGRGGQNELAYGTVGAYGLSVKPANLVANDAPFVPSQADGEIFNTISVGKASMPGYAHQVKVQDRWAIVAYLRVLQYATNGKQ